jgi:hypothetical protein
MITFLSEAKRRADSRQPSVFTWYIDWTIDEVRCGLINWLVNDVKAPAILCTEIKYIKEYAPPIALSVVMDPVDALLNPIEGYNWFECLAALEDWAIGFNEIER